MKSHQSSYLSLLSAGIRVASPHALPSLDIYLPPVFAYFLISVQSRLSFSGTTLNFSSGSDRDMDDVPSTHPISHDSQPEVGRGVLSVISLSLGHFLLC